MEDKTQRYWISDHLCGPYRTPLNHGIEPPGSHYAARISLFNGEPIFCCWNQSIEDGPSPFGLIENIGQYIRYVPSPIKVMQSIDGTLKLAPFKAWDHYKLDSSKMVLWNEKDSLCNNHHASLEGAGNRLEVIPGMDGIISDQKYEDFMLEGQLHLKGPRGGISIHLQDDSTGYFIELSPAEYKVKLIKHLAGSRNDGSAYFQFEKRQENTFDFNQFDSVGASFMLRVVSGEIEFSLNEHVLISTVSTSLTKGKVGLFVESGEIKADDFRITQMKKPYNL